MRGISDLDSLCLRKIFKNLTPLDLCSVRHCSKGFRYFVEDHFRSLYFIGEKLLDLTVESDDNVSKILKHFGKFCRHLKVHQKKTKEPNLMLDVILTNCGKILKRLSLNSLHLYQTGMVKCDGVFDNLEFLELIDCQGDEKSIEFEYPNLTTLRIISTSGRFGLLNFEDTDLLKTFFLKKRSIKALTHRRRLHDDLLPLIALNAPEIEMLDITIRQNTRNLMFVAQLKNLKLLQINSTYGERLIISLIRELSVCTKLEILGLSREFNLYTEEFWDALSNLTNLKQIRLSGTPAAISIRENRSIEMLVRKLTKLESFMVVDCFDLNHRHFLELVCKSDRLRKVYVWENYNIRFDSSKSIEQIIKDFIGERRHRSFVSGNPLCLYLDNKLFNAMQTLLTQDNLKSIEKYGNIKISRANPDDFSMFPARRPKEILNISDMIDNRHRQY